MASYTPEQIAEMDSFDRFQFEKYGNILTSKQSDEIENGIYRAEKELEQVNQFYEIEILNL